MWRFGSEIWHRHALRDFLWMDRLPSFVTTRGDLWGGDSRLLGGAGALRGCAAADDEAAADDGPNANYVK